MIGYCIIDMYNERMASFMYAVLRTRSKIISSFHPSLNQYTRKQSKGFSVSIMVDVEDDQVKLFEELADIKMKTSEKFQGIMTAN